MLKAEVRLINPLGLHARAAAKLVRTASRFKSTARLDCVEKTADAKSIFGVLTLAASCGRIMTISVEGEDEDEALAEIQQLIESGFGEV